MCTRQILSILAFLATISLYAQNTANNFATSVQGHVYADLNRNGQYDADDVPLKNTEVISECTGSIFHTTTNDLGKFVQPLSSADCKLRIIFKNKSASVFPEFYSLGQYGTSDAMSINGIDFRIVPNDFGDSEQKLSLTALSAVQNGQMAHFELKVENDGRFSVTDTVSLAVTAPFSFRFSKPAHVITAKEKIYWEVPPLQPYEIWTSHIVLQVAAAADMGYQTEQSGVLTASMPLDEGTVDEKLSYQIKSDFNDFQNGEVKSNSKSIVGSVALSPSDLEKGAEMLYFIRFQNLQPGLVENLTVFDSMDTHLLGQSFEMVSSSHPYQIIRDDNNVVRWIMNGANLTDTLTSLDDSQGHILFRVRVSEDLLVGDYVANRAFLKFDDQPGILTEPAVFIIREDAGFYAPSAYSELEIFPNPTEEKLFLRLPNQNEVLSLSLCNLQGEELLLQKLNNTELHEVQLPLLAKGVYLLYVQGEKGSAVQKLYIK